MDVQWWFTQRTASISTRKGTAFRTPCTKGWREPLGIGPDYLVVMNRHDFRAAERLSIVPGDHLRYMPGTGVDTARFQATHDLQAQAAAVRTNLQIPADAPAFLVVAEFIRRKRHVDVIQAFAGLATVPKAHLLLAGSGPLQPNLRQLVHELGLQDRIHFLGERRDVPTLLHAASALLLASEQEGLPRAILEAMSAGLPVIATRIRGSEDLLHPDRGLLVETGRPTRAQRRHANDRCAHRKQPMPWPFGLQVTPTSSTRT